MSIGPKIPESAIGKLGTEKLALTDGKLALFSILLLAGTQNPPFEVGKSGILHQKSDGGANGELP